MPYEQDPCLVQTAAGLSTTRGYTNDLMIIPRERSVLRSLAQKVGELAERSVEREKQDRWTQSNDLKDGRPPVFCDPENAWMEAIPQDTLQCETPLLRVWEMALRKEIFWGLNMGDDRVIEPYFNVPYSYDDTGWRRVTRRKRKKERAVRPIQDYDRDFPKLKFPDIIIDDKATDMVLGLADDILGEFLEVRLRGMWWWSLGLTREYVTLRGLDKLLEDMEERPDWVHRTMEFLTAGMLKRLDYLESEGLLPFNAGGAYVGSGGFGWTTQLPADGFDQEQVRTIDMWGFGESQKMDAVTPDQFAEFILPYQTQVLERFGLNCYGCCEPLEGRWKHVKTLPRLRRISVSPGADAAAMAKHLGGEYVYSWKADPAIMAGGTIDEAQVRETIRGVLDVCRSNGCHPELIMKDNVTIGNNPQVLSQWCRIAREEAERY